jgi:hypothetical protein
MKQAVADARFHLGLLDRTEAAIGSMDGAFRPTKRSSPGGDQTPMDDFHLLDEAEDRWWGYSQKDGWVVMDFADPRNRPPNSTRYLIRCQDQREVAIAYADWMPPMYISAVDYLRSLGSTEEQARARETILAYQWRFADLKKGIADSKVREAQERERLAAEKVAKAKQEQAEREAQQSAAEAAKPTSFEK